MHTKDSKTLTWYHHSRHKSAHSVYPRWSNITTFISIAAVLMSKDRSTEWCMKIAEHLAVSSHFVLLPPCPPQFRVTRNLRNTRFDDPYSGLCNIQVPCM